MSSHRVFIVRELSLLLKLIACMAVFRSTEARERSGYDGVISTKKNLSLNVIA